MKKQSKSGAKKSPARETFHPMKVGLAVAAAASACLVLFAVVAMYL